MKRKLIVSLVVMLLALVLVPGMALAAGFTDIGSADADTKASIEKLTEDGIIDGYPDGTFHPENKITRSEFTKIANLAHKKLHGSFTTLMYFTFSDVPENAWYNLHLQAACNRGIMEGTGDGKFSPNANITGNEVVAVLCRTLGYTNDKVGGTWPTNYQNLAKEIGILDGLNIDLSKPLTRGEVCQLTSRTLEKDPTEINNAVVSKLGIVEKIDTDKKEVRIVDMKNNSKTLKASDELIAQLKVNGLFTYTSENDTLTSVNITNIKLCDKLSVPIENGAVELNGVTYPITETTKVYRVSGDNGNLHVEALSSESVAKSTAIRGIRASNLNFSILYVAKNTDLQVLIIADYGHLTGNHFGYAESYQVYIGEDNLAMNFFGDEVVRKVGKLSKVAHDAVTGNVLYQYWADGSTILLAEVDREDEEIKGGTITAGSNGELYTTNASPNSQFIVTEDSVVMKVTYNGTLGNSYSGGYEVTAVDYDYELSTDDVVWVRYMINGNIDIEAAYVLVFKAE